MILRILTRLDDAACDHFEKFTIVRRTQPSDLGNGCEDIDPNRYVEGKHLPDPNQHRSESRPCRIQDCCQKLYR